MKYWAVFYRNKFKPEYPLQKTKKQAITQILSLLDCKHDNHWDFDNHWDEALRDGWRCIQITITTKRE